MTQKIWQLTLKRTIATKVIRFVENLSENVFEIRENGRFIWKIFGTGKGLPRGTSYFIGSQNNRLQAIRMPLALNSNRGSVYSGRTKIQVPER